MVRLIIAPQGCDEIPDTLHLRDPGPRKIAVAKSPNDRSRQGHVKPNHLGKKKQGPTSTTKGTKTHEQLGQKPMAYAARASPSSSSAAPFRREKRGRCSQKVAVPYPPANLTDESDLLRPWPFPHRDYGNGKFHVLVAVGCNPSPGTGASTDPETKGHA